MLSVSSRIWIRVAVSISDNDNHYTTAPPTKIYILFNMIGLINNVKMKNIPVTVKTIL